MHQKERIFGHKMRCLVQEKHSSSAKNALEWPVGGVLRSTFAPAGCWNGKAVQEPPAGMPAEFPRAAAGESRRAALSTSHILIGYTVCLWSWVATFKLRHCSALAGFDFPPREGVN